MPDPNSPNEAARSNASRSDSKRPGGPADGQTRDVASSALCTDRIGAELDSRGYAHVPGLLDGAACAEVFGLYEHDALFRKRIVMRRHGYGSGEYKYFDYPLPARVQELREALYAALHPIANRWQAALGSDARFPSRLADWLAACHHAGQTRATPLMLEYGPGDYNRLHQDVYGDHVFPLQMAVLLSTPRRAEGDGDFEGGELVLTEQRPRMQSRASVVPLERGDAVVFPVRLRPVRGPRGHFRVQMRHGVSEVRSGRRRTLGIILHDAS